MNTVLIVEDGLSEMKSSATGLFPEELYSFLEGYFIEDGKKTILSLDPLAILESTAWGDRERGGLIETVTSG